MAGRSMRHPTLAGLLWLALFCWAVGVLWLSSLTPQELPDTGFLLSDKVAHFIAYAVGGWLAATALRATRPRAAAGWFMPAVLLIAAFGVLDEAVQTFTPGRTGGDVRDWIADVLGAVAGAGLSMVTRRFLRSRRTGPAGEPPTR